MTRTLGVVLAGGASSRFGEDKAAAPLGGKTMLAHVCERAAPQVEKLVINRNGERAVVLSDEYEIMPDQWPGEGPLAGIITALEYARSHGFTQLASFPCDTPFFPTDLVSRLREHLARAKADCCVARQSGREHHAFALWNVSCVSVLRANFLSGMRSLKDLANILSRTAADIPPTTDSGMDDFLNINTQDDLDLATRRLTSRPEAEN